tara:strand:+ start:14656 stop:15051 length:396 start_codon:yes stop_codon:yes gene_type:complete
MGFFDKMFKAEDKGDKLDKPGVPWIQLDSLEMLEQVDAESYNQPVAILKHSTSCGISRMVLRQFEKDYDLEPDSVKLYFLDLLRFREISNRIASKFNVPHESPQLIILKDGKVVHDSSHSAIEVNSIKMAI